MSKKFFKLSEIADFLGGQLVGNGSKTVSEIKTLSEADKDSISFIYSKKFKKDLESTSASVVLITKDYIDIVRLKPRLSKDIPGEELYLESTLTVSTAKESSAFNAVSLCSYINTPDVINANETWIEIENTN